MKRASKTKAKKPLLAHKKTLVMQLSVVSVMIALLASSLAVSARNGLHESAVKIASDEHYRELLKPALESKSSRVGKPKMRPAKTRKEADSIIAQLSSSNSTIAYDPWGRLAKLVEPDGSIRQFVYSGDRLCEERDGTGTLTKQFYDWGEVINGTKYFYTRDHLGSITELTDQTGNIVAQYKYDPWGNVTRIAGSGPDSDFLYAGYFYHKPSKLYITRHRLYSPKLGRWLNRDPIDESTFAMTPGNPEVGDFFESPATAADQNQMVIPNLPHDPLLHAQLPQLSQTKFESRMNKRQNPYNYASNNPVSKNDPSGLDEDWAWCSAYCTLHARGALAWILCMQDCMRGFPSRRCPTPAG